MRPKVADFGKPADGIIKFVYSVSIVGDDAFDPDKTVLEVKDKKRDKGEKKAGGDF